MALILAFFGLEVYSIVLGYLIDHIKPNTIQFEGFHIIMECPQNGPLYLATGVRVDFLVEFNNKIMVTFCSKTVGIQTPSEQLMESFGTPFWSQKEDPQNH